MKYKLIIVIFFYSFETKAQRESNSFFSKLYFPVDFGLGITNNPQIKPALLSKSGVEYRLDKTKGLFFRFNLDNQTIAYKITQNTITNATNSDLAFTHYSIGTGYRAGNNTWKAQSLLQVGVSAFKYPVVAGEPNNYQINYRSSTSPIFKITSGIEYYLDKKQTIALTLEGTCHHLTNSSVFWGKNITFFAVSFGLTTILF